MITVTKISEQVYILKDRADCVANLILGKERALLFDTGCGVDDMKSAVRKITLLPLVIIASHGHYDHIGGSYQFEKVYLSELDISILEYYHNDLLNRWIQDITKEKTMFIDFKTKNWEHIRKLDYESFNLGDLECRVIPLPGHTKGSIGIFIPSLRLLLSGDALTPVMCLMFLNHLTKEVQKKTLMNVQELEFDYYLTSHHDKRLPKSLIGQMIACIEHSSGRRHHEYQ